MIVKNLPSVPEALADVSLIDGPTAAAAAGMSISKFQELVGAGEAPAPVVRRHRFTRWQAASIRSWLVSMATAGDAGARSDARRGGAAHQ